MIFWSLCRINGLRYYLDMIGLLAQGFRWCGTNLNKYLIYFRAALKLAKEQGSGLDWKLWKTARL